MVDPKILGSVWFTVSGMQIGIVVMETPYEQKAYIGKALGRDQHFDEGEVIRHGSPFPLKDAKSLCGVK